MQAKDKKLKEMYLSLVGDLCCSGYCVPEAYQVDEEDCCCPERVDCSTIHSKCERDEDCGDRPRMHCCWDTGCSDLGVCILVEDLEECNSSKCMWLMQAMLQKCLAC